MVHSAVVLNASAFANQKPENQNRRNSYDQTEDHCSNLLITPRRDQNRLAKKGSNRPLISRKAGGINFHTMKPKLTIGINGKLVDLDAAEARRIYNVLRDFFGESNPAPVVIIERQPSPVYIQPAPIILPAPVYREQPGWPLPQGPTCIPSTGDPMPFSPISICKSNAS